MSTSIKGVVELPVTASVLANNVKTSLPNISLTGQGKSNSCLSEGVDSLLTDIINEEVSTVFGKLEKSLYGSKYSIVGVNENQTFGQSLLGVGVDCIVMGATGSTAIAGSTAIVTGISNIPSIADVIAGSSSLGDDIVNSGKSLSVTLTKITCGC